MVEKSQEATKAAEIAQKLYISKIYTGSEYLAEINRIRKEIGLPPYEHIPEVATGKFDFSK
ncbi:MAG: hypothetical protein M0Z78_09025 [Betaproteobacteria bacterium]|nr:hypothetical protein [Betaproteobacteria bacterium]